MRWVVSPRLQPGNIRFMSVLSVGQKRFSMFIEHGFMTGTTRIDFPSEIFPSFSISFRDFMRRAQVNIYWISLPLMPPAITADFSPEPNFQPQIFMSSRYKDFNSYIEPFFIFFSYKKSEKPDVQAFAADIRLKLPLKFNEMLKLAHYQHKKDIYDNMSFQYECYFLFGCCGSQ